MARSYPKHKFAVEVHLDSLYVFSKLFSEEYVARRCFDKIQIQGPITEIRVWHDYRVIFAKDRAGIRTYQRINS